MGDVRTHAAKAITRRVARRVATTLLSSLVALTGLPALHAAAAPPPSVSVDDVSVTEGALGTTAIARFTLTLSAPAGKPVGVKFTTQDGTATAPSDYLAASGTASIKKGATTRKVAITVNGDDAYEGDETFTLHLISARGATIGVGDGTGTILDDDPVPSISIADASVLEGTGTTTPMAFDVTLSGVSASDVTVDYATADGTATAPGQYLSAGGTLTWPAGTSGVQTVTVDVVADAVDEPDQTFTVSLSNPTGSATIGTADATGVILDDDLPPAASPEASKTTVTVVKRRTKTIAKGAVTPAHSGLTATVTLLKRKSGVWVPVGVKTPTLGTAVDNDLDGFYSSPFRAAFKRMRGRQKVVVQFLGDADHLASSAQKAFKR